MNNLKKIISEFDKVRILVVGDLILDQYIWGDVDRISPEAPVPVVWANKRNYVPGGAANVANNITALGARASLCGVLGDRKDPATKKFQAEAEKLGINTKGVFFEEGRKTTLKTRIIAGHQQVVRVDWEDVHNISQNVKKKFFKYFGDNIKNFDAVIVEDYGKGLLDRELTADIIKNANAHGKIVTIDPKENNFDCYKHATCITPNRKEAQNAIRYLKMKDRGNSFRIYKESLLMDKDIIRAGEEILGHLQLESLLITLGENGMWLFEKGKNKRIPTVAQKVFDVSGAGDTVISVFTMALSLGASKMEAAYIANFAAGIVVGKLGTAVTNQKELLERIK
ncbi:MAG: D-glycero-beta-D-manno-heptose-7-phosphate kinase [Candidatus Omnitrophica bacterium]|jgi:D-beta-D-heptose 7-phosphate kinase/D-beta-D-heptose 1-phosphate adenosyltransferase|nr:D-glycero-beta-D-manno-heptose-7-phosphate kinase [Candidatus Omnitrophota bacterium]MDD3274248.1 D-glycero-beta-D-manno-heptose-7-phosphate kinase [Candidatus Omnitrophota bacterium]MDD5077495.1 D-glycero-beta-D-manno-heptose-7-phosphate kinase [Candidatus Omnitrophota bacterium]MDD5724892.1 D-glycero-beta-D-manno-heptose-7-phosphate kinase [Candidatus Omnitrophota bacterium]